MTRAEAIKVLECLATDTTGELAGCQGEYAEFLVRVVDALDMAIAALKEQDVTGINVGNKWISVKERLPEVNRLVLCYRYNASRYRIGFYIGAKYTEDVAAFRNINKPLAFGVTHWMPLPEPPKEEQ